MHKFILTGILAIFLAGCHNSAPRVAKAPQTPKASSAKAEEKLEKKLGNRAETPTDCDAISDPSERRVCWLAKKIEADKVSKNASEQMRKSDSPAMRQARKEIDKAEHRKVEIERSQQWAVFNSNLSGCDAGTVWVDPGAVITTARGFGGAFARSFVHGTIFIVNKSHYPVDITNMLGGNGGLSVGKLCPGGKVRLGQYLQYSGYSTIQYSATAQDVSGSGRVLTSYSPTVTIYQCNSGYCQTEYTAIWEINLQ